MTIVSHRHKFIFLKSRKTAGTSVSAVLADICGDEDILALSEDVTELTGIKRRNVRRPIFGMGTAGLLRYGRRSARNFARMLRGGELGELSFTPIYQQHMTIHEVREAVGESIWAAYYKFSIERNPYDRLVSFYHWRKERFKLNCSFEEFAIAATDHSVDRIPGSQNFSNRPFYLNSDGELGVDRVLLFESLQADFGEVLQALDLKPSRTLPNLKAGIRKQAGYREHYPERLLKRIKPVFSVEERLFGYSF